MDLALHKKHKHKHWPGIKNSTQNENNTNVGAREKRNDIGYWL